jgi:hypothetical protein
MAPVHWPAIAAGDDARAQLAQTTAALEQANKRLAASRSWYLGRVKAYRSKAK